MSDAEVRVERFDEAHRYQLTVDGKRAGFAEFRTRPGQIVFTHTVVYPGHEGQGLGSILARSVLDDAVARGERIVPRCPFIAAYIRRHPEPYEASVDWPEGAPREDSPKEEAPKEDAPKGG